MSTYETNEFEWSENFDGVIQKTDTILYINLKMVCENGGAQTRSLREVYHFVSAQIRYLENTNATYYFVNILDGEYSFKHMSKFTYLNKHPHIFCGDMYQFQKWYKMKFI